MVSFSTKGDNPVLNSNNEIWKPIKDYEDRYLISNQGRVKSIQDNHGNFRELLIALIPRSEECPYYYVKLTKKSHIKNMAVHRLVALHFIDNPEDKSIVNHIDGNKLNNNVCNLEWCTHSENHIHAYATGLKVSARAQLGKKAGNSSKYNNVSWDKSRNKWKAFLKNKGKILFQKRFETEIEAAEYVNLMLDKYGLTDRARNII